MNYIRHLNAFFFRHVKRDKRFTANHVSLYIALFQFWNYNRFQNEFSIIREEVMSITGIGSKNTYHKCLKDLHEFGYIFYTPSSNKFQKSKVHIVRLDSQKKEVKSIPLDLFTDTPSTSSLSHICDRHGPTFDTVTIPKSVQVEKSTVPHLIPTRSHICDRHSPIYDTDTVPYMGLLIKHKHKTVNSICIMESANQVFEKNKKIQNQLSCLKKEILKENIIAQNQNSGAEKIVPDEIKRLNDLSHKKYIPDLKSVEEFFSEKKFPSIEASKFFYYNQGRNWMINPNTQISDWQAMAHKWMILQNEKEILKSKTNKDVTHHTKSAANAAFLKIAKSDFHASTGGKPDDRP